MHVEQIASVLTLLMEHPRLDSQTMGLDMLLHRFGSSKAGVLYIYFLALWLLNRTKISQAVGDLRAVGDLGACKDKGEGPGAT